MSVQQYADLDLNKIKSGSYTSGGSFASVYKSPFPGTVIKQGRSTVDGWLIWAHYVMSHPNPSVNFPRIHRLHVDFKKKKFSALMDELNEASVGHFQDDDGYYRNSIQTNTTGHILWEDLHPTLVDVLKDPIEDCLEQYRMPLVDVALDMHNENYMEDVEGELIINDPFSYLTRCNTGRELPCCSHDIRTIYKKKPKPVGITFTY